MTVRDSPFSGERLGAVVVNVQDTGPEIWGTPPILQDMALLRDLLVARRPALFLDYDGTLTPIVERPEDARLSANMRRILRDAARAMPVAVVSGRDLEEVRNLVGIREIVYAGSHGFDIEGPGLRLELPVIAATLDDLDRAAEDLSRHLAPITGVRLERKRFAVAVHYRQVADKHRKRVESAVHLAQKGCSRLRRTSGKKAFELRPNIEWDKGRAIRWLLTQLGLDGPDFLSIYLGDDLTDEDAFRALRGRGLGILVADAPRPSAAAFRLMGTDQAADLLRYLVQTETSGGRSSTSDRSHKR
jgi:trehalose 6-phosphate phosphatase